jgi:hypothetical protein
MTLNPEHYECPDHHVDVTGQVTEKMNRDPSGISYLAFPGLRRRGRGPEQFKVIVTCPGAGGAEPHLLTCTGTRTP